jgi:transcriptional regulator with XRE-family HTH domain
MEFGRVLQAERQKKGLRRADVARQLGVNWLAVYRWERGDRFPSPRYLLALLHLFPDLATHLPHISPKEGRRRGAKRAKR